jgi:hypothetical protein
MSEEVAYQPGPHKGNQIAASEEGPRQPDPHKANQIAVVGKKGTGKTELGWLLFESYPFDRLLIDPNGDIKPGEGPLVEIYEDAIPARWPSNALGTGGDDGWERNKRQTVRFIPDFGSPTFADDIDRALGLAYTHGKTMAFIDECHEAMPAGRTPPHARRALRQGRHHDLSLILATPRPVTVDPLVIAQADWVYVFKLPNPNDRKRVAECIGWDPKTFDQGVFDLGPHEYLRYDSAREDLAHFPALPEHLIAHHKS